MLFKTFLSAKSPVTCLYNSPHLITYCVMMHSTTRQMPPLTTLTVAHQLISRHTLAISRRCHHHRCMKTSSHTLQSIPALAQKAPCAPGRPLLLRNSPCLYRIQQAIDNQEDEQQRLVRVLLLAQDDREKSIGWGCLNKVWDDR
jgi:hypothetical protein